MPAHSVVFLKAGVPSPVRARGLGHPGNRNGSRRPGEESLALGVPFTFNRKPLGGALLTLRSFHVILAHEAMNKIGRSATRPKGRVGNWDLTLRPQCRTVI